MKANTRLYCLIFIFLTSVYGYSQQVNYNPAPRPKNCKTENSCPRNTFFHETTFRFDRLGLNWNSLNWDHILVCREKFLVSFRLGLDYYSFAKIRSAGIPLDLNLMIGGGTIMGEIGAGLNYLYIYKNYDGITGPFNDKLSYLAAVGHLGLRYQKQHGIFFRAGYTPMYSLMNNDQITITTKKGDAIIHDKKMYSMFAAGIGYTF